MEGYAAALKPRRVENRFILRKRCQGTAEAAGHSAAMEAAKLCKKSMVRPWYTLCVR